MKLRAKCVSLVRILVPLLCVPILMVATGCSSSEDVWILDTRQPVKVKKHGHFELTSTSFKQDMNLPREFVNHSIGGYGHSPDLQWDEVVPAKSYAVTVFDKDTSKYHWIVVNIPHDVYSLRVNAAQHKLPSPAHEVPNSFGHQHYVGPFPPKGATHSYIFTVYALDTKIIHALSAKDAPSVIHHHLIKSTSVSAFFTHK